MANVLLSIVGYFLTRRGEIDNASAQDFASVSDACAFVKKHTGDVIAFVQCDKQTAQAVRTFLVDKQMDLYDTKQADRYVLGSARRPRVECAIQ